MKTAYKKRKNKALRCIRETKTARFGKDKISQFIHQAVCTYTRTDGFGQCILYAIGGATLLSRSTGETWYPQVGSISLQYDSNSDQAFAFDAELGGLDAAEFHAWAMTQTGDLVDFSTRHFMRHIDGRVEWKQEPIPDYFWFHYSEKPKWVRYRTVKSECERLYRILRQYKQFADFVWLKWNNPNVKVYI